MAEIEIKGLRELRDVLVRRLPLEVRGKALQRALAKGTAVTIKQVRANASRGGAQFPTRRSGTLAKAIFQKRSRFGNTEAKETRIIGVRRGRKAAGSGKDAYYWKWVEFGHRIVSRSKAGGTITRRRANAAGFVPPRPFMRPAFESTKATALHAIIEALQAEVARAVRSVRF